MGAGHRRSAPQLTPRAAKRPKDRRDRILDAAAAAFAQRGFDGVTVADLARAVGVTGPALYGHFTSKDDVLASMVTTTIERLDAAAEATPTDDDGLEHLVRSLVAAVLDQPWYVVAYLRERHRWIASGTGPTADETRFLAHVDTRVRRAMPGLGAYDRRLRVTAAAGVLRGAAERARSLARPAAEELIAASVVAMMRSTPVMTSAPSGIEPPAWRPQLSPRERILDAALPLFRTRGVAGVGMGEIGDAAGVGATNVYRYYESKDEVLVDIYDRVGARVEVAVDEAVSFAVDAEDALVRLLAAYTRIAFDAADLIVIVDDHQGALPSGEWARLRRRDRRITDVWRAIVAELRPGLRVSEVNTLVAAGVALINGFARFSPDDLPPPAHIAPLARAVLLGGAR